MLLPSSTVSPGEVAKLRALIAEFSDVFALKDSELGCTDILQHHIDTAVFSLKRGSSAPRHSIVALPPPRGGCACT